VNNAVAKMDGLKPLNNILVIGMTNRKEVIDEALLRPSRFEVCNCSTPIYEFYRIQNSSYQAFFSGFYDRFSIQSEKQVYLSLKSLKVFLLPFLKLSQCVTYSLVLGLSCS